MWYSYIRFQIKGGSKMKSDKILAVIMVMVFFFSVSLILTNQADAQKIIKKTVKKVVNPEIAPTTPPEADSDASSPALPTPPAPADEDVSYSEPKGLFGWGWNTDLNGFFQSNTSGSMIGARGNIVFDDPFMLGSRIGLAEDAIQYKLGLGYATGRDNNNATMSVLPLFGDVIVYLPEGLLFGLDPYVGGGINANLYGSGATSGGSGSQVYGGVLVGSGNEAGKTGIEVGYKTLQRGSTLQSTGITVGITQPFIL